MYEYILTKRRNTIISRLVWRFRWTLKASLAKVKYHETKNGKSYLRLPIKSKIRLSKSERLKSRPFSEYHYKLIEQAYSQKSKSMQILKKCAEDAKRLIDIENMSYKLKAYKSSLKHKNSKNMLYKIETHYTSVKQKLKTTLIKCVSNLPEVNYLASMNRELSKDINYHHISIKDRKNNVLMLMVNCAA